MSIDFDGLAARLLSDSRTLLESWFPSGKWRGREFVVGNLAGDPGESLSINSVTGLWSDFSSGDAGGDLISLHAARAGIGQADAARELGATESPKRNGTHRLAAKPTEIILPPADARPPGMIHPIYGHPSSSWTYRDASGSILGYIARYDPPDGRKQIVPWTYSLDGWHMRQFPEPRPLYGLDQLAAHPDKPVMLVEGEKTADAARTISGPYVVVTWPGGCQAWRKTDLSPIYGRSILCVPDADLKTYPDKHPEAGTLIPYDDQPGQSTMAAIAAALAPHCPEVKIIDVRSGDGFDPPDGWDLADAVADGWDWPKFRAWAVPRISVVSVPIPSPDVAPGPQDSPPPAIDDPYIQERPPWPEPADLFSPIFVPDLNPEFLPPPIAAFAFDQATIVGTDPAILAIACITSCAAAIHDGIRVQPHEHNYGWTESARLWSAIVGDPSIKKSPAISRAISHLRKIDIGLAKIEEQETAKFKLDQRIYEAAERKHIADPVKHGQPIPPQPPQIDRLIVEDITVEKLSEILKTCPRGVLRLADELSSWFGSMDAYKSGSGGKDRGDWLEAYNGGPRRIDRIARGSILVPNWSVCMLGGIQPDVLRHISATMMNDGLLQRFMVVIGKPGSEGEDRHPDHDAQAAYRSIIDHLYAQAAADKPIPLSIGAREVLSDIVHFANDRAVLRDILPPALCSHLGKWEGLAPRLMLTFHMIECAAAGESHWRQISEDTAARVFGFMTEFLFRHAVAFYTETISDSGVTDAVRWIGGYILSRNTPTITNRELLQNFNWWKSAQDRERASVVARLEEFGWIRPKDFARDRFKPVPSVMETNPKAPETYQKLAESERIRRSAAKEMFNHRTTLQTSTTA